MPKPTVSNDAYIGDYVFATANKKMALMYLVPRGVPTLMNPDDHQPTIVICSDQTSFTVNDAGGAIYELSSESFTATPQEALNNYEMVSTRPVKPIRKQIHDSTLAALLSAGIKVKFVDTTMFDKLIRHPQQKELIDALEDYSPQS